MNTFQKKIQQTLKLVKQLQEDIEIKKSTKDDDYDNHRALILNLTKLAKNTSRENKMIIEEGITLIDGAENNNKEVGFIVQELVVNLTSMYNELKKLENLPEDQDKALQKIKKTLRYTVTAIKKANQDIKAIHEKRQQFEAQLEQSEYFSELERIEAEYEQKKQQIAKKYNVEVLQQIEEQEIDISNNASKIEEEAKEVIREIRGVIKNTYAIPTKIIDEVKISLRAFGALATISKVSPRLSMSKEGIIKIMEDKKLFKILGEFIKITEYSDKVQIVNAAMPKMKTYFLEFKTQMEEEAQELDQKAKTTSQETKSIKEGVVKDITMQVLSTVSNVVTGFFKDMKTKMTVFRTKVDGVYNELKIMIKEFNTEHVSNMQNLSISFIQLEKLMKKAELEYASSIEKEIK